MSSFKKRYRDLEMEVLRSLRDEVESSNFKSSFSDSKAIKIDLFGYSEIALINDLLFVFNKEGYRTMLLNSGITLEDLIDILE